jgi:hypothetical protein
MVWSTHSHSNDYQPRWSASNSTCPEYNYQSCQNQDDDFDKKMKVKNLVSKLNYLTNTCNSVLEDLDSANSTEFWDSMTSNQSLIGSFISNWSYHQNHQVAKRVDRLRELVFDINNDIRDLRHHSRLQLRELDAYFSGEKIRQAENAEHSFFGDWLTSGNYSSWGSCNTSRKISLTHDKVEQVKEQAQECSSILRNYI